jgi:hypothetical protein
VLVDVVPCTRSEFEEEKHEIDTLARGLRPGGGGSMSVPRRIDALIRAAR